jgi:catecholate siderophore receptor
MTRILSVSTRPALFLDFFQLPLPKRTTARTARIALICVVLFTAGLGSGAAAAPAQAAEQQSRIMSGTVLDATGGAIGGSAITLKTAAGERKTVTDAAGSFVFQNVPLGAATLTVTFAGFAPATLNLSGPRGDVRVVLQPVPVTEAVTVRASTMTAVRTPTATRTDAPLRDVPQAVSVIARDLIADQTMRSMADVVNYVPGVGMAQGEGHRDAPIFRGNTSTADFFVDGMRDDTQYLRDLYNVERVEVLKGPNGMVFGRGGVGGVINRVTRQAGWTASRELSLHAGAWGHRRLTADLGDAMNGDVATRLTGMYENSGTYRAGVDIERYGVNPTAAFAIGPATTVKAGYEFFRDERTTDRGVPSFQGRPLDTDPSTFFGSTDVNRAEVTVHGLSSIVEHRFREGLMLRNRVRYADYDKYYQNLVPGAVNTVRTSVALTGYNSGTQRQNLFNQTDLIASQRTGRVEHTLLAGVELGRQVTDNLRLTGFFPSVSPTTTSISVPLSSPTTPLPVEFRASAREADNHGVANTAALYAQDQIALSRHVQAIVGVRYDTFDVDLLDSRTATELTSNDGFVSPRLALVYKPAAPVSVYASYTRAYLPRAGEQLASLSLSNQALDPESFRNYEVGAKWEIDGALSFTTAVYRLDHGNVVVRDAVNPNVSHLVDAERTNGLEMELTGNVTNRWSVQGGYAYQDGEITRSLSSAIVAGARLAQVPRHSFSIWNKYDVSSRWGVALGVISRSDRFVATDNTVVLPAFTRVDGAVFFTINQQLRAHVNLENMFDERYYWAAHNNNNIAPGSPRAVRVALTTRF